MSKSVKNEISKNLSANESNLKEPLYEGVYGTYKITQSDQVEVQLYRLSLLICAISFSAGLGHWLIIGPTLAWAWLIPIANSVRQSTKTMTTLHPSVLGCRLMDEIKQRLFIH